MNDIAEISYELLLRYEAHHGETINLFQMHTFISITRFLPIITSSWIVRATDGIPTICFELSDCRLRSYWSKWALAICALRFRLRRVNDSLGCWRYPKAIFSMNNCDMTPSPLSRYLHSNMMNNMIINIMMNNMMNNMNNMMNNMIWIDLYCIYLHGNIQYSKVYYQFHIFLWGFLSSISDQQTLWRVIWLYTDRLGSIYSNILVEV